MGRLARGEGEAGRFCDKHRVNKLRMKRRAADRNIPSTGCGDIESIVHWMCTRGNRRVGSGWRLVASEEGSGQAGLVG